MRSQVRVDVFVAGLTAILLSGCGSSGDLGEVTGTVMLDGRPLPEATVEFQPPGGSPSMGVTDGSGSYSLMYTRDKRGATPGQHKVRITLPTVKTDARGREIEVSQALPARYNRNSELTAEVKSGSNQLDFRLRGI